MSEDGAAERCEPITGCAAIQADKRMWPCFLISLLLTLHLFTPLILFFLPPCFPLSLSLVLFISFIYFSFPPPIFMQPRLSEMFLFVSYFHSFPRQRFVEKKKTKGSCEFKHSHSLNPLKPPSSPGCRSPAPHVRFQAQNLHTVSF